MDYVNNLYGIIEDFYRDDLNIGKTHRILKGILEKHKENKIVNNLVPINSIILFQLKEDNNLKILLSSKFVYHFHLKDEFPSFEKLNSDVMSNLKIELDERMSANNLFILKKYKNNNYVYFVEFSRKINVGLTLKIYIDKILRPLFGLANKIGSAS